MPRHRLYSLIITITALSLLTSSCGSKQDEPKPSGLKNMAPPPIHETVQDGLDVEPNNTFLQAKDITLSSDALMWSGSLDQDDIDTWLIKGKSGTIADIMVSTDDNFDIITDISTSTNEQERRFYNVKGPGQPELIPNLKLTPQGVYLTVRGRLNKDQSEGKYKISITRVFPLQDNAALETEYNNVRESAVLITNSGHVEGSLYPAGDVDYFRIPLSAASTIAFQTPSAPVEIAIENRDKILWSVTSRQPQMLKSDILTPDLQDVYIRIKSLDDIQEPKQYSFDITTLEKIPDEIEPNNTIDKAQTIQGDNQSLEFSLLDDADIDIFRINLDKSRVYRARLTGPQLGQAKLQLLTSSGTVRKNVLTEEMTVCDATVDDSGALWLKVLPGAAPWPLSYRIAIDSEDASKVEQEPNQTSAQANTVQMGTTLFGHIFPAGDVDVYRIAPPQYPTVDGTIGTLNIDIEAGYVAQLQLKLMDSAGYEISQANNHDQLSRPMHMALDVPNGTYELTISGSGDSCLKPYGLKVSFEPNEAAVASLAPAAPAAPAPVAPAPDAPAAQAPAAPTPVPAAPAVQAQPREQDSNANDIPIDDLIQAAQGTQKIEPQPQTPTPAPTKPGDDEDAF